MIAMMKKRKRIKLEDVKPETLIAEVRALAREHPAAKYPIDPQNVETYGLSYITGECGPGEGCLIGQAFQRLNVPFEDLARYEGLPVSVMFGPDQHDDSGIGWLSRVQTNHDSGIAWGEAVNWVDHGTEAVA